MADSASPRMAAFYRRQDFLAKAYRDGDDWRVTTHCREHNGPEYWFSVWSADVRGSLFNALERTAGRSGFPFDPLDVVLGDLDG